MEQDSTHVFVVLLSPYPASQTPSTLDEGAKHCPLREHHEGSCMVLIFRKFQENFFSDPVVLSYDKILCSYMEKDDLIDKRLVITQRFKLSAWYMILMTTSKILMLVKGLKDEGWQKREERSYLCQPFREGALVLVDSSRIKFLDPLTKATANS